MKDLHAAYIAEATDLMAFYEHPPTTLLTQAPTPPSWDKALLDSVNAYQVQIGSPGRLAPNETVIVTGQQPGLFTGPLYTIYKAATAIRLAEELRSRFDVPCTPVFWVESDDHDFDEVRTAHFLTKTHETLSLQYTPSQDVQDQPLYRIPVEDSLHELIDQAAAQTPGSEFRKEVTNTLHDTLSDSRSLAEWTTRLLAYLFKDTSLVLMSPQLPVARTLGSIVFEQEIAEPLAGTRLLLETGQQLKALGYPEQVVKKEANCNFFLEVDGRRRKVLFKTDRYLVPAEDKSYSVPEMLQLLHDAPEQFSPNVVLRCILQQRLFPTAAYVAGPSEVAYWAQTKPLFNRFGLPMPVVYPRTTYLLTNLKLKKLMAKFGFDITDLTHPPEELYARALQGGVDAETKRIVQEHRKKIAASVEALENTLTAHDKKVSAMAGRLRERITTDLERFERSIAQADEVQATATRKQVTRLCNALAPWRKPQERVYTVFSFLFEHGWSLIPRLIQEVNIASFDMHEVEL